MFASRHVHSNSIVSVSLVYIAYTTASKCLLCVYTSIITTSHGDTQGPGDTKEMRRSSGVQGQVTGFEANDTTVNMHHVRLHPVNPPLTTFPPHCH